MAVIRYGDAVGDLRDPAGFLDLADVQVIQVTPTVLSIAGSNGYGVTLTGTGFTYGGGALTGGTATGVNFFAPGGAPMLTMTGLSVEATFVMQVIQTNITLAIMLLAGDDRVIGSSNGDIMAGGGGNDTVLGGGGKDLIAASDGRDKLTGGAAKDAFVFLANTGQDKVMDFADSGAASDDVIVVRRAQYDAMVMTQEGDDVLLSFGRAGTLLIVDQTLAEMGLDDFTSRVF